jgi:hypothetical protein
MGSLQHHPKTPMGLPRSGGGRRPATCRARFERRPAPDGPQRSGGAGAAGLRGDVARPEGSAAHPREREKVHNQRRRAPRGVRRSASRSSPNGRDAKRPGGAGFPLRSRARSRPTGARSLDKSGAEVAPLRSPTGAAACARACGPAAAAPPVAEQVCTRGNQRRAAPVDAKRRQCPLDRRIPFNRRRVARRPNFRSAASAVAQPTSDDRSPPNHQHRFNPRR